MEMNIYLFHYRIRGRLGSLDLLFRNIGTMTIFIAGAYIDYIYLPRIFVIIYFVYLITFSLIPNTPQFYLRKGKYKVCILKFFEIDIIFDHFSQSKILKLNFTGSRMRIEIL